MESMDDMDIKFENTSHEWERISEIDQPIDLDESNDQNINRTKSKRCTPKGEMAARRSARINTLMQVKYECLSDESDGNGQVNVTKKLRKNYSDWDSPLCDAESGTILGISNVSGQLEFLFKFKDQDQPTVIPAKVANIKYPYTVMSFYEKHVQFHEPKNNDNDNNSSRTDE